MKMSDILRKFKMLLLPMFLLALIAYGCDNSGTTPETDPVTTPTIATGDPSVKGSFKSCSYTSGLEDNGYESAIIYYPCDKAAGPFAATTLTGGFTNNKEQMTWISDHIVTHGFIVIAMTPNNNMGNNPEWRTAHNAGIAKLKTENSRSGSPITGLLNTNALQIMGFSKGGGGTLLAASDQGANIKSAQAIAPYMDSSYNISAIKAATICYTGTDDRIASPTNVVRMFNALPGSIDRTLAYFNGFNHVQWLNMGSDSNHTNALTYITAWMKVYLNGDTSYESYLDGHQDWFNEFKHYDAGQGSDGNGSGGAGCGFN